MQLPPPQVTRAVIQRFARLRARYSEDLGVRPFVLPDSSFFPDHFNADSPSLAKMTRRMQAHAGLRDIPIQPVLVLNEDDVSSSSTGCSGGACAVPASVSSGAPRLFDDGDDGWRIQVPQAELRHPTALATNLARSLAFIFLIETQRAGERLEPPLDVTADLVAVQLGFGPLLLQGSFIYAKGCSGPRVASFTKMTVAELAIAVALFAALGQHPIGPAYKALDVTQRALLRDAHELVMSNRDLVQRLLEEPSAIASGAFELDPPGGFFSNWFRSRKKNRHKESLARQLHAPADLDLDQLEALVIAMPASSRAGRPQTLNGDSDVRELAPRGAAPVERRAHDDLRAIVEESLEKMRA